MNLQFYFRYFVGGLVALLFAVTTIAAPAYAYQQSDLDRLLATKNCPACDLTGASLKKLDLTGADLSSANLDGAVLSFSNLKNANLAGASLKAAKLGLTDLSGADLTGASLDGAIFYDTIMPDGSPKS